jgi:hypothetical protein
MAGHIPRHRQLAQPRAAAALGILGFAGIGATIMAPQAFIIGAIICWLASIGVAYFYPDILAVARLTFNKNWGVIRSVSSDLWLALGIILFTLFLPPVLFLVRPPISTDITLEFSRPTARVPLPRG